MKGFITRKYNIQLLTALVCLCFTILGLGAGELYLTNESEFWFRYSDILPTFIICGLAFAVAVFLLSQLLPEKGRLALTAIVFYLDFAFYIQGNFIPNDYGTLNGEAVDWSAYRVRGLVGIAIWLIIAAVFIVGIVKKKDAFLQIMTYAGVLVLLTQAVSLIGIKVMYGNKDEKVDAYFSTEDEFTVSSTDNVIVLLLDCFDAAVMDELIEKYPEEINTMLEDFTYYRNTVGGATRTKYAIPFIITGETNKKEISYLEYVRDSSRRSPLFKELNKGKYDARIFDNALYYDTTQNKAIDNLRNGTSEPTSKVGLARKYLQLVMYKSAPQFLKKNFWMYSGEFDKYKVKEGEDGAYAEDDVLFYRELCDKGLTIATDETAFRFYHLAGDHPPYSMNEYCERVAGDETDELRQALGGIRIANEYISQMKELGVFDKATVIIMSDHGAVRGIEQNPVFIVKDSDDYGTFKTTDIRISYSVLSDYFADRLADSLIKMSDYNASGTRFFYVDVENSRAISIVEFSSDGDAWEHSSFVKTGRIYHGDSEKDAPPYKLGKKLYFTFEATATPYEICGFNKNEGTHTWTSEKEAKLRFVVKETINSDLVLHLGYIAILGTSQTYVVKVNDYIVGAFRAMSGGGHDFFIPKEIVKDRTIDVTIVLPDAYTSEEGQPALALAMSEIWIDKYSNNTEYKFVDESVPYKFRTKLSFSTNEDSGGLYCFSGFSASEAIGTWTDGDSSRMGFSIEDYKGGDIFLIYDYMTYGSKQHIIVYANEAKVADYDAVGIESKSITINSNNIGREGNIYLRFEFPDAISPVERNESEDTRKLALLFKSMELVE